MSKQERENLFILKYKKGIKNTELAEAIGVSNAMISIFFNNKASMGKDKVDKLVEFIHSK